MTDLMNTSCLAYIVNPYNIIGNLPVSITDECILRKANESEIDYIRNVLSSTLGGEYNIFSHWNPYEKNQIVTPDTDNPSSKTINSVGIPKEDWRYYVLACNGSNGILYEAEKIGFLLPFELQLSIQVHYSDKDQKGSVVGWNVMPTYLFEFYMMYANEVEIKSVNVEKFVMIGKYMNLLNSIKNEYEEIQHSINNFYELRKLTKYTPLITIGYFSVLESIITHQPQPKDTIDSIKRQVKTKMKLLRKRFENEININSYFGDVGEEKIWSKLYDYRSAIAHGRNPNVQLSSNFSSLKDTKNINTFLKDTVKELLLLSLREPEFVTDIRDC